MKYRHLPTLVDAVTFDELAEIGRQQGALCYGPLSLPWSFTFQGHAVTHENDDCYLVNLPQSTLRLSRGQVLITGETGEAHTCPSEAFADLYEPVG